MSAFTGRPTAVATGWYTERDCRVEDLHEIVGQTTTLADYPHADDVVQNVLIYGASLPAKVASEPDRRAVQTELARALLDGPGIVVFKRAFETTVVDRATAAFNRLIAGQKASGAVVGDHFAKPGANDRVWGALDKLAVLDPETFVAYYANEVLALVSEAWLGPNYQVTSQVNVVNPGGQAQVAHRDYHLGFMDRSQTHAYPAQVHTGSSYLRWDRATRRRDVHRG
jgi:hypothetical protein